MTTVPHEPTWYRRAGFDVQEFSANGIRTFAVVEGRRDSFPVIFLHGFPGGAFLWEYIIAALGRQRLAIAPDFPGWGRSVSQFDEDLPAPSPEWARKWIDGLRAAQSIEGFDLVAHGTAAWVALELLVHDADRVRRLALINPRLWPHRRMLRRRRKHWSVEQVSAWLGYSGALSEEAAQRHEQSFASLISPKQSPPRLNKQEYIQHSAEYLSALRARRGRTLLIWGENDLAYSRQHNEELISKLDRPEVHRIADAGHFPMLDQLQMVTPILREFLEE